MQEWLDAAAGSCVLALPEVKGLVGSALRYFDGERYQLDEFVVAVNHVHALVTPSGNHMLSSILHSWKWFTAHEILKVAAAVERLRNVAEASRRSCEGAQNRDGSGTLPLHVWQKESFEHIVRNPAGLEMSRIHPRPQKRRSQSRLGSGFLSAVDQRRDAAATLT